MQKIPFIRSLMEFNKRVLYQGTLIQNKKYNLDEIEKKLFFNKIFISNMQEMFQKFDTRNIIDDYVEELSQYIININEIIKAISISKSNIKISREDSFERRLSIEGKIAHQLITNTFNNIQEASTFKFVNNCIYYISLFYNNSINISYIDMKSAIYNETINCQMSDYKLYWKTDDCITDYIQDKFKPIDTIAIRVTTHMKKGYITKVEYNGSSAIMRKLISMFQSKLYMDKPLIVSNPFIYVDDIEMIVNKNIDIKPPITKSSFKSLNINTLMRKDTLLEYPNDSFDEYLQFINLAVNNKDTKAIYITLYRIGKDPAIFYILRDAVDKGIKVHINIELCASGEDINIMWMNEMRKVGIEITTYECRKLKVHCKLTLLEFNNGMKLAQIGTGNYHTQTAAQYTDLNIITGDSEICKEIKKVFKIFKGKDDPEEISFSNSLLVTRYNARNELINLIDEEGDKGKDGYIMIKCNSLDDREFNNHLELAASKGCKIDLIIRGVCTWIPKSNYRVKIKSIVWDKLEHSRLFGFGKCNPIIYLGSLDLVTHKIDQRIETLVLVKDPDIIIKLCNYMNRYITNITDSWVQTNTGFYIKE